MIKGISFNPLADYTVLLKLKPGQEVAYPLPDPSKIDLRVIDINPELIQPKFRSRFAYEYEDPKGALSLYYRHKDHEDHLYFAGCIEKLPEGKIRFITASTGYDDIALLVIVPADEVNEEPSIQPVPDNAIHPLMLITNYRDIPGAFVIASETYVGGELTNLEVVQVLNQHYDRLDGYGTTTDAITGAILILKLGEGPEGTHRPVGMLNRLAMVSKQLLFNLYPPVEEPLLLVVRKKP